MIVWLLLDYFEGGDTYTVEGVYASREGAVAAFQQIANNAIKLNADDPDVDVEVEWDDTDSPVIYGSGSGWFFHIEQVAVNP